RLPDPVLAAIDAPGARGRAAAAGRAGTADLPGCPSRSRGARRAVPHRPPGVRRRPRPRAAGPPPALARRPGVFPAGRYPEVTIASMNTPADSQLDYLRVPPHSIEAEQSVLGGLLLDNAAWDRIADVLVEEDFYRHDHRLIWHHIARLIGLARPADVITDRKSVV